MDDFAEEIEELDEDAYQDEVDSLSVAGALLSPRVGDHCFRAWCWDVRGHWVDSEILDIPGEECSREKALRNIEDEQLNCSDAELATREWYIKESVIEAVDATGAPTLLTEVRSERIGEV